MTMILEFCANRGITKDEFVGEIIETFTVIARIDMDKDERDMVVYESTDPEYKYTIAVMREAIT